MKCLFVQQYLPTRGCGGRRASPVRRGHIRHLALVHLFVYRDHPKVDLNAGLLQDEVDRFGGAGRTPGDADGAVADLVASLAQVGSGQAAVDQVVVHCYDEREFVTTDQQTQYMYVTVVTAVNCSIRNRHRQCVV